MKSMKPFFILTIVALFASFAQADLIVDVNPNNSSPNIATFTDFVANDADLDSGTAITAASSGGGWAGVAHSFDGLTLTQGGGRAGNARGGNASTNGYTGDTPILGGSVLTNGTDPALTLDLAGLSALDPTTSVVVTLYGIGDNIGQDTVFTATTSGGGVQTGETVYNTNFGSQSSDTGSVPFVQFTYSGGGDDSVAIVLSPSVADTANGETANPRTFLNGFSVSVTPVPEPSSLAVLMLGMVGLATRRRNR